MLLSPTRRAIPSTQCCSEGERLQTRSQQYQGGECLSMIFLGNSKSRYAYWCTDSIFSENFAIVSETYIAEHAQGRSGGIVGNRSVNREPTPSVLDTATVPWWACTTACTRLKPN